MNMTILFVYDTMVLPFVLLLFMFAMYLECFSRIWHTFIFEYLQHKLIA